MASVTVVEGAVYSSKYCPCVVCFKNVFRHQQNLQEPNSKLLQLFIKLLQRMSLTPTTFPKEYGLCNDCAIIVGSVTKLFHQIQCFQMQLDWNLRKMVNIMVVADMVPSRMEEFQKRTKCEGMITNDLQQFRYAVKNNLKRHANISIPKVVLHDYLRTTPCSRGISDDNSNNNWSIEIPPTETSVIKTNNAKHLDNTSLERMQSQSHQMERTKLNFGLGWIVSFITVTAVFTKSAVSEVVNRRDSKSDIDIEPSECGAANELQEHGSTQNFKPGKQFFRLHFQCASCLVKFPTLLKLESHKTTCNTEIDRNTGTESDDEEKCNTQNPAICIKTETYENEFSSEGMLVSLAPSDKEDNTSVGTTKIKNLELFECIKGFMPSYKNTYKQHTK